MHPSRPLLSLIGLCLFALLLPSVASAGPGTSSLAPRYSLDWSGDSLASGDSEEVEELSIEERRALQARLKLRRKMVRIHQALSFVAAGSIIAADVIGTGNKIAIDSGSPRRADIEPPLMLHRVLATTALTSYLGAGILAWTAPPALRLNQAKPSSATVDSGKLHVAFSVIHGIAMATVIATGILQANVAPAGRGWDALITTHSFAGFTAAGFVLAAGITIGTL